MVKFIFFVIYLSFILMPASAEALFDSCDFMPKEPRPRWINGGYSKDGYYTAVGLAEKSKDMDFVKLQDRSKQDAYSNLAQNITVVVESSIVDEQLVVNDSKITDEFVESTSIASTLTTKEVLRGVVVSGKWLDRKKCILYTRVKIKKTTVERIKKETLMQARIEKINSLLSIVKDKHMEPDINKREKALTDIKGLFKEIDFTVLKGALSKEYYIDEIDISEALLKEDIKTTKNRVLVAAIDPKGEIPESVLGKVLDFVKSSVKNADRLHGNCDIVDTCISGAYKKGFSRLVLLKLQKSIEVSEMGSYKGILKIDTTVYDVLNKKILKGPDGSFAEVISWSEDELDWDVAADKIIESKLSVSGF